MEDNNRNANDELHQENSEGENTEKRVQYTKQQSFLYTVISVALFFHYVKIAPFLPLYL